MRRQLHCWYLYEEYNLREWLNWGKFKAGEDKYGDRIGRARQARVHRDGMMTESLGQRKEAQHITARV